MNRVKVSTIMIKYLTRIVENQEFKLERSGKLRFFFLLETESIEICWKKKWIKKTIDIWKVENFNAVLIR